MIDQWSGINVWHSGFDTISSAVKLEFLPVLKMRRGFSSVVVNRAGLFEEW